MSQEQEKFDVSQLPVIDQVRIVVLIKEECLDNYATEGLIQALGDHDRDVRQAAITALKGCL